jgi:hypothetical protein
MAAVVQGVTEVHALIGRPPVIVGGLAVLARLSDPYRATVDLDIVDRLLGDAPQLELLRAADGAEPVEPAAVLLPTSYGAVKVDVLEVRQVEIDQPSAEPGPLVAMKLQAVMNRSADKQGTDLLDIVRLAFDQATRPVAMNQIAGVADSVANDIALHIDLWFVRRRQQALQWIRSAGGEDVTADDLDLVAELLSGAAQRTA